MTMEDERGIVFTVYGEPQGKARPVVTRTGHAFTPKKTVTYEAEIVGAYRAAYPDRVLWEKGVPLRLRVNAYYGIPKSATKRERAAMLAGEISPTKKPDFDNIGKIVSDALNGIAYHDDAQITDGKVRKEYSEEPRIVVWICEDKRV